MNTSYLVEKEVRNGVRLTAQMCESGALILVFKNLDGSESSLKVTNRDAHAYRKIRGLTDKNIQYTGASFKLC
jgi:hypothetical protein